MEAPMETTKELKNRVAALESKIDMLESELSYLNQLLMKCGFPEGVITLKSTVEEILSEGNLLDDRQELI
jgi:hypothetical protein